MFGSFGGMELLLILIIVMIIFGAGKLPQLGEGLGKAIKGFKKSVNETQLEDASPQQPAQEAQSSSPSNSPSQPSDSPPHSQQTETSQGSTTPSSSETRQ